MPRMESSNGKCKTSVREHERKTLSGKKTTVRKHDRTIICKSESGMRKDGSCNLANRVQTIFYN